MIRMRSTALAVLLPLACAPAGRSIGNAASLTPVAPSWVEYDPSSFAVQLDKPGYLAVFRHSRGAGQAALSLVYAQIDSARRSFDIALNVPERPARAPFSTSAPRVEQVCTDDVEPFEREDSAGLAQRRQPLCSWRLVTPEPSWSPRERTSETYYVILAFSETASLEAITNAVTAVAAGKPPAAVAAALGERLFGDGPRSRWAATVQFVP